MAPDSFKGIKPPASDVIKVAKTSPRESKPTISEFFRDLRATAREKINRIFTKDQPPQQTLKDLAEIKIPQDTQEPTPDQTPETNSQPAQETTKHTPTQKEISPKKPSELEPIIHDHAADQAEISKITKTIQDLKEPTPQPPETTPEAQLPKLFPDRPSLYEQHHKEYDQERKTIKGALQRSVDILRFKKYGVKNAEEIYDNLRSRGISRTLIKPTTNIQLGINPEESIRLFKQSPIIIDRLYSIDSFNPKDFNIDFIRANQNILNLSNEQFAEIHQQLNPCFFLKKDSLPNLFTHYPLDPQKTTIIDFLKREFIDQNHQESDFDSIKSAVSEIITKTNVSQQDIASFIKKIVNSDLHPNQKIEIPDSILELTDPKYQIKIKEISDNNDRDKQKIFINLLADGIYEEKTLDFLTSLNPKDQKIWTRLLTLKDAPNGLFKYLINNRDNLPQFIDDGGLKSTLFETMAKKNGLTSDFLKANLTPEVLASFSLEDQKFWSKLQKIQNADPHIFSLLLKNKDILDSYFNENNIKSGLLKLLAGSKILTSDFLKANLTPEVLASFSLEDQKFWSRLLVLKKPSPQLLSQLSYATTNSIFNRKGQPKSILFEDFTSVFSIDFLSQNLTQEILKSFSRKDRNFWTKLLDIKGVSPKDISIFVQYKQNINSFFKRNGEPNKKLLKLMMEHGSVNFLKANLTPEALSSFTHEEQKKLLIIFNLKDIDTNSFKTVLTSKVPPELLIDGNGKLTPFFFETFITHDSFSLSCLRSSLTSETIDSFPSEDQKIWKTISTLITELKDQTNKSPLYKNIKVISQKINSSTDPQETLKQYVSVIEQINSSPSKEILKIKDQLLVEILNSSNPLEAYQKISDIFIKNNLPMVGKIYRVFDVLYPSEKISEMLNGKKNLSRVLTENQSSRLRQFIIFNDLLKVNLGSGESSLVNYLNLFQTSSPLLEKARTEETLTQPEAAQLSSFFKKLDTLYDASLLSRLQPTEVLDTSTLQSKIDQLYQKYKVAEGQTISDRIAQMYLSGLGIRSIPEALDYINQTKESAHQRNLSRTDFSLGIGDLIKGVKSENLGDILNFGCVAREYLGADSSSDYTPFDTDVIKSTLNHSSNEIISSGLSGYGDLYIIIKDRGQFQNTTQINNPKYNQNQLEIFKSNVKKRGDDYGIRTGFPSSEIDFIVTTDTAPQKLENIYYEIAKHGVYIPILNKEGKQIFAPTDYQRYRHSFDGVKQFGGEPIQVEFSQSGDPFRQEIDKYKKEIETESSDEVSIVDTQIKEKIKTILDSLDIKLKDEFDNSLLGSRLYDIGSSGRHTNLPKDFDFDYNLVLDAPSYAKSQQLIEEIKTQFTHEGEIPAEISQIRLTKVSGIGSEPIKLDIGVNTTASTLIFASHEAIEQKLDSIKQSLGEDTYREVVANILLTKQILKDNHAYKKTDNQDGGFGGIGTENWILSNNGSIKKAFETFWQAAHSNGQELSLDEFRKRYFILDAGENFRETGRTHDNFVFILTDKGYHAMLKTIGKYLK